MAVRGKRPFLSRRGALCYPRAVTLKIGSVAPVIVYRGGATDERVFYGPREVPEWITNNYPDSLVREGWALRLPDGSWERHHGKRDAQAAKKKRRRYDVEYNWAATAEDEVRKALKKAKPRHVKAATIDEAVDSTFLYPGRDLEFVEPNPFRVYVFTDRGLGDPFHYEDVYKMMNQAADAIRQSPWYEDAGWESVVGGVSYFWLAPLLTA